MQTVSGPEFKMEVVPLLPHPKGDWVAAADYDALTALIDQIEGACEFGLHDCSKLMSNPPQNPAAYHVLGMIRGFKARS